MRSVIAIALFAACAEPVVEMQLIMPKNADSYDTSCITAVEVFVDGENFPQDRSDYRRSCIEVQGGATYAAIRDAIRGKFEVAIPDTGLATIEVYGWSGPAACDRGSPFSPDLLFFGRGDYNGEDRVDIPLVPNLNCTRSEVKVRMFDMFALAGGATCAVAGTYQGSAGAGIGTLVPSMFGKGTVYYGNLAGSAATGNLATFMGLTQTGPKSCLAIDGGSDGSGGSTGCAVGGASVCAGTGELEHATVPFNVINNSNNFDTATMAKFPGVIFGSVWAAGTTKTPISGATIDIDTLHGKVVYLDPPNAAGALGVRTSTSTGPSGLFMIYTDALLGVKVNANGMSRTVTLGGSGDAAAATMIVMGP